MRSLLSLTLDLDVDYKRSVRWERERRLLFVYCKYKPFDSSELCPEPGSDICRCLHRRGGAQVR